MAMGTKRQKLIADIKVIIVEMGMRMTVRQIYYQLVSKHIIENSLKSYKSFDATLTLARKEGQIDPYDIIDTSKPLLKDSSWDNLSDFIKTIKKVYKKSVWPTQESYVEVWLEKDALRGVFEPITNKYDCYLVIGKGYQSYTNLMAASDRFSDDKKNHILYFGDFDPTGKDIPRNIEDTLEGLGTILNLRCVAITPEQIKQHNIPPIPTKKTDSRTKSFIKTYGDNTVELDALNPRVLKQLIEESILEHIDLREFEKVKEQEKTDKSKINKLQEF